MTIRASLPLDETFFLPNEMISLITNGERLVNKF